MDIRMIKSPSEGTKELLRSRTIIKDFFETHTFDAVGLIQGKLCDIFVASDIAEKTSGVKVLEVKGICPQHFALLAIFGDTSSVSEALKNVSDRFDSGSEWGRI